MTRIKCIVIEDEPLAAKILTDYIAEVPFLELRGVFRDAILATGFLREHGADLMFLDIHLPRLKGMAFLKSLQGPPAVIVTTAYHEYAVEGFSLNVTDYLLKPFDFERFLVAVNKVARPAKGDSGAKDAIFLSVQKKKVRVPLSDIVYIESQREYVRLVTTKGEWLSKMGTHEIEAMLPARQFRRVHRSFIISLGKVESYTADTVELNGISIPIGRAYRDAMEGL